tara:strand:- start:2934 stop:3287 length:354 start_codon:yes stop_codon:yes gene_type:complete
MPSSNSQSFRKVKPSRNLNSKLVSRKQYSKRSNSKETSDVLISAVVSPYLLTHLHNVLQKAEFLSAKEGRISQSANFAQLRKVLCMDARSMEDASAFGFKEVEAEMFKDERNEQNVA